MDFLIPLFRVLHVIAAAVWFGGGIYALMLVHADLAGDMAVAARYNAQIGRVSKVGLIMPIASISTALFGVLTYGAAQYWTVGVFTDLSTVIFHIGVLLGIIATIHGGMSFGKIGAEINGLTAAAVNADGTTNPDKLQALNTSVASFGSTLNIHAAMVIGAFICMTVGATF